MPDEDVFLHVDAAQSFGKLIEDLRHERIDMISASGHKLFAPKGVGALLLRRRGRKLPPLTALGFGGGQERGLRPGTVAVPLVAAFGLAAEIATTERVSRQAACEELRMRALEEFADVGAVVNGDRDRSVSHIVNVAFPGADAEAVVLVLKDIVAISTGSACTSHQFEPSHVLRAMQLPDDVVRGAVRFSWTHDSDQPDWATLKERVRNLMR
jgi:cysteine desulfurase